MDTVGMMTPLSDNLRNRHEVAFTLSFEHPGKARRRTPDNWQDFETCTIRLKDDRWTSELITHGASKPPPKLKGDAALGLRVLVDAGATQGERLPSGDGFPSTPTHGITERVWRCEFYRRNTDRSREARQKAFKRMASDLRDASLIGLCGGWVWLVQQDVLP
jgi:hypothetical protein